jgi:hypothetical protein
MRNELSDYEWTAIKPMLLNELRGMLREQPACPQRHLLGSAAGCPCLHQVGFDPNLVTRLLIIRPNI